MRPVRPSPFGVWNCRWLPGWLPDQSGGTLKLTVDHWEGAKGAFRIHLKTTLSPELLLVTVKVILYCPAPRSWTAQLVDAPSQTGWAWTTDDAVSRERASKAARNPMRTLRPPGM